MTMATTLSSSSSTVELVKNLRRGVMAVHYYPKPPDQISIPDFMKQVSGSSVIRGTAFAIASDKFVTCNHVTENLPAEGLRLTGAPDYTSGLTVNDYKVLEVEGDPESDLALLKAERLQGEITPIPLDTGVPQIGLDVLAIGYPLPEQSAPELIENEKRINVSVVLTFRVLRGIIASRLANGLAFEIDKLVNPGQSGGPIVSIESGRAVGMSEAYRYRKTPKGEIPADLSICICADVIRRKLSDWKIEVP
jgi:S1-C subfamily serine protease